MKIILGSGSHWRKHLLSEAGFQFDVMVADIDEKSIREKDAEKLVLKIARAKADVLIPGIKEEAILITADQVVVCNGQIFEKPQDATEVYLFAECYSKYPAKTVTGVIITNTKTGKQADSVDIAEVTFNPIPREEVDRQIKKGEIFFCAGGFQIEAEDGSMNPYIKTLNGTLDSVKGLPIDVVKKLIESVS